MKQLALGFIQYVQDYDEQFPGGGGAQGIQAFSGESWANQIYSYEKSTGVYKCPDDLTNGSTPNESYAFNLNLGQYQGGGLTTLAAITGGAEISSTNSAKCTSPTQTVLLFEANGGTGNTVMAANPSTAPTANTAAYPIGNGADSTESALVIATPTAAPTTLVTSGAY